MLLRERWCDRWHGWAAGQRVSVVCAQPVDYHHPYDSRPCDRDNPRFAHAPYLGHDDCDPLFYRGHDDRPGLYCEVCTPPFVCQCSPACPMWAFL